MENEYKWWCITVMVLGVVLACVIVVGIFEYHKTQQTYIRNGYTQSSVNGVQGARWVKE